MTRHAPLRFTNHLVTNPKNRCYIKIYTMWELLLSNLWKQLTKEDNLTEDFRDGTRAETLQGAETGESGPAKLGVWLQNFKENTWILWKAPPWQDSHPNNCHTAYNSSVQTSQTEPRRELPYRSRGRTGTLQIPNGKPSQQQWYRAK